MPKRKRERWTTSQAAAHCGVLMDTFRSYVNRGLAPRPLPHEFGPRGERIFLADEIRRWHANRPGPGTRTDLKENAP